MSHTKDLIDEAMLQINDYLQKAYDKELEEIKELGNHHRTNVNKFTEKFGVHVTRVNEWNKLVSKADTINAFVKLSIIQFYDLASAL